MAIKTKVETLFGEDRELYIRLNNFEQLTNHDEAGMDIARFRGYASEEAFKARKAFMVEILVPFHCDVTKPVWEQAYAALKAYDPSVETAAALSKLNDQIGDADNLLAKRQKELEGVKGMSEMAKGRALAIETATAGVAQAVTVRDGLLAARPVVETEHGDAQTKRAAFKAAKDT